MFAPSVRRYDAGAASVEVRTTANGDASGVFPIGFQSDRRDAPKSFAETVGPPPGG